MKLLAGELPVPPSTRAVAVDSVSKRPWFLVSSLPLFFAHPLRLIPLLLSQHWDGLNLTRAADARKSLRPPVAVAGGNAQTRQSSGQPHRALLHLVDPSIALGNHQIRRRRPVQCRTSPPVAGGQTLGEDLPQIQSEPSDRDPVDRTDPLKTNRYGRSRPFRSALIQRLQVVIHPKGYQPIRTEHVAASELNRISN
jgi:hypothetical protein